MYLSVKTALNNKSIKELIKLLISKETLGLIFISLKFSLSVTVIFVSNFDLLFVCLVFYKYFLFVY